MTLWPVIPEVDPNVDVSVLVSVLLPGDAFERAVLPLLELLRERMPGRFEVIVAPFGEGEFRPVLPTEARLLPAARERLGRGIALRNAFLAARGRNLIALEPQQPCDPAFFLRAYDAVLGGADLVRANRRLSLTRFRIPVRVLPMVYKRHRLGVAFNWVVRKLLPIETSDTHAGNMAMSRRMATAAFSLQRTASFLFYVELSLVAATHDFVQIDMPERLYLQAEKSVSRVARETAAIALGLPAIVWRYLRGYYGKLPRPQAITADDWGLSPAVNRGIVGLAREGVVRRVSMLAGSEHLREHLDELQRVDGVQLGLHFNLTHQSMAPSPSAFLNRWILARGEEKQKLIAEVRRQLLVQLAALRAAGVTPQYLDGHHHIHLTPGLLAAVADVLREQGIDEVRIPYDPALWTSRKAAINVLALLARGAASRAGLRYRRCLYPSMADFLDHGKLRAKIARRPEAEIIVHPATEDDFERYGVADSYAAGRATEYLALRMVAANLA